MVENCAKSCGMCDMQDAAERCAPKNWARLNMSMVNTLADGELDALFERIVATHPTVQTLSRPPKGPWILRFEDFLAEKETKALLRQTVEKMARSNGLGEYHENSRTSEHTWCRAQDCQQDPHVQRVLSRVADLTGIESDNFEDMQVLRYRSVLDHARCPGLV